MSERTLYHGSKHTSENLPAWFQKPEARRELQYSLFDDELGDVQQQLGIGAPELQSWYQNGWLSFDPDRARKVEDSKLREIVFVRDVMRAGLPMGYVENLLSQLPRPLNIPPDRIAYSFSLGWVEAVPAPETSDVIEDHLDEWLQERGEEGDVTQVLAVMAACHRALEQAFKALQAIVDASDGPE